MRIIKAVSKKNKVPLQTLSKEDILNALRREARRRTKERLAALSQEDLLALFLQNEELQKALF